MTSTGRDFPDNDSDFFTTDGELVSDIAAPYPAAGASAGSFKTKPPIARS